MGNKRKEITKTCTKCNNRLTLDYFYKNNRGKQGRCAVCKDCSNAQRRAVYLSKKNGTYTPKVRKPRLTNEERITRKEEMRQYQKAYRKENRNILRIKKKEYRKKLKLDGIESYSGKCSCCGEDKPEFLTLDHVNGRNRKEKRNRNYRGTKMWMKAKAEGYPKKYRVLCFNCNCAIGAYGYCPHEKESNKNANN